MITTGEALAPHLVAWSSEALDAVARQFPDHPNARNDLKWSYADSQYVTFTFEERVLAEFLEETLPHGHELRALVLRHEDPLPRRQVAGALEARERCSGR